ARPDHVLVAREIVEESAANLGGKHRMGIYVPDTDRGVAAIPRRTWHWGVTGSPPPYAIVDFPRAGDHAVRRLSFTKLLGAWRADTIDRVCDVLYEVERAARGGSWVVGFVTFEAASAFDGAFAAPGPTSLPLAWFGVF